MKNDPDSGLLVCYSCPMKISSSRKILTSAEGYVLMVKGTLKYLTDIDLIHTTAAHPICALLRLSQNCPVGCGSNRTPQGNKVRSLRMGCLRAPGLFILEAIQAVMMGAHVQFHSCIQFQQKYESGCLLPWQQAILVARAPDNKVWHGLSHFIST